MTFLQGIAAVLSPAIGKALFMTQYSAEQLPLAYAAVSVLLPLIGVGYLGATRRISDRLLLPATAVLCAVVPAATWVTLLMGYDRVGAALAVVWTDAEWALIMLVFLGVATRLLDVRQQRRLLGLVAAGDVLAGMAGGFSLPLITSLVGLRPLLLVIAAVQLGTAAMAAWALRRPARTEEEASEEEPPTPLRALLRDPFLRKAWLPLALSWFVLFVVDALFLAVAEQRFPTEESLGGFMGVFLGTAGVADAIASIGLYALIVGRFGVKGGLVAGPLLTAVLALPLLVLGFFGPATVAMLLAVSGLKLGDITARENIGEPVVSTLYGALPAADRGAAQAAGGTIIGPLGALLAAPVLWAVLGPLGLGIPGLVVLVAASAAVWAFVAARAGDEWPAALSRALDRGTPEQADVTLAGGQGIDTLLDGLTSADRAVVVGSARLLRSTAPELLRSHLGPLLSHRDRGLRIDILRLLEEQPITSALPPLAARVAEEDDARARGILYRALVAAAPDEGGELLAARLGRAELSEQGRILDALVRHGGDGWAVLVGRQLHRLKEGRPAERQVAAALLGSAGGALPGGLLAELLADDDREVQRGALAAVVRSGRDVPWAEVFACVDDPELLGDVERAVQAGGGGALKALDRVWDQLAPSRRGRLLAAAVGADSPELRVFLLSRMVDPLVGRAALAALVSSAEPTEEEELRIRDFIGFSMESIDATRRHASALVHGDLDVVARALREDADEAIARVVAAYGLLHPGRGLDRLDAALLDPEGRPLAVEVLESVLSREDWLILAPYVDPEPDERTPPPAGELPAGASTWARLCLGDLAGARARSAELRTLREVPGFGHLRDRELAVLADAAADGGPIPLSDDPRLGGLDAERLVRLIVDVPPLRVPLLDLLAGTSTRVAAEETRPAGVPLEDTEALRALRSCAAFRGASRPAWRALVAAAEGRELGPGQILPKAPGGHAVLIASGTLRGDAGRAHEAGSLLELRPALRGRPRRSVYTSEGPGAVLLLPARALRILYADCGPAALAAARRLLARRSPAAG